MRKYKLDSLQKRTALKRAFPNVTTISDADESINVTVSEVDAKLADPLKHEGCAMAVACKRQLHADGAVITLSNAYIVQGTHATRYTVTEAVKREITSFDRHGDFRPGLYTLSRVPLTSRIGRRKEGRHTGRHTGRGRKLGPKGATPKVFHGRTVGIRE